MLSESEFNALKFLVDNGGSVLVTQIPERNEKGLWGEIVPGLRVYKKLEKAGFVLLTEEEPIIIDNDIEFTFTPSVEITECGKTIYNNQS